MVTIESLNTKIDTMSEQITALVTLIYAVRAELLGKIDEMESRIEAKIDEKVGELAAVTARGFLRVEQRLGRIEGEVFTA